MSTRFQSRRTNGRFQKNTLANTFGLRAIICAACNSVNAWKFGEVVPTKCHACGAEPLRDVGDASDAGTERSGTP